MKINPTDKLTDKLDKYNPIEGDEISITSITYMNNNNVTLSKSEYKILEIIELSTKPTWNSSELTVEDIKSICKSNSNKIYNYIKTLKEKNFIAECVYKKKHYYYINPHFYKRSKEIYGFVTRLFDNYSYEEREKIKFSYMDSVYGNQNLPKKG